MQNRNRIADFEKHMLTKRDREEGRDGPGLWDWHKQTKIYGMIGQWGPAGQHREPYPIFCDNLCGKGI